MSKISCVDQAGRRSMAIWTLSGRWTGRKKLLIFIIMTLNNHFITTLYLLISTISLLQRYLYNNHTILQLIIGLLIGTGFGYLTYLLGNKYITGNIKMKKDDNAPL